jgi:MoaA/NifB/PqqE/SkfB family radical SAM enzyme
MLGAKSPRPDAGFLWDGIVNGPVRSRRLGVSLGLNLTPARSKLCTFDCPYCECGFNTPKDADGRWPSPDEVAHSLRRALTRLPSPPDCITFAGNGEPTMHPRFPVVVERVLEARAELAPGTKVGALTNGLAAGKPAVRDALRRLDLRMVKLDPGPSDRVNGVQFDQVKLARDARALAPLIIQAMVTKGRTGMAHPTRRSRPGCRCSRRRNRRRCISIPSTGPRRTRRSKTSRGSVWR